MFGLPLGLIWVYLGFGNYPVGFLGYLKNHWVLCWNKFIVGAYSV